MAKTELIRRSHKPVNRNFFAQGTDEAYALRLIDDKSLRSLLTLNCLFFDFIAIGATDLLGNPILYRMLTEEKDAMTSLYHGSSFGEHGVLQPVIIGDHKTMTQVAEDMIRTNTIYRLSKRADLENHAQLIDDAGAIHLRCSELDFRRNYYENVLEITKYLNIEGLRAWSNSQQLFPVGSLSTLLDWLINKAPNDYLRCSAIIRFADGNLPVRLRRRVKMLGEAIYQYSLSQTQIAALSTPGEVAPFIDCMNNLSTPTSSIEAHKPSRRKLGTEEIRTSLPIQEVTELPLRHLVVIRSLPAFREMRSVLADFRQGSKSVSITKVQSTVDQCTEQLLEYLGRTDLQRVAFVESVRKNEKITRMKIWYDISAAVIPLILSLTFPGGTPTILAVIASGTLLGFSQYLLKNE